MNFVFNSKDKFVLNNFLGTNTIIISMNPIKWISTRLLEFDEDYFLLERILNIDELLFMTENEDNLFEDELNQLNLNKIFYFVKQNILLNFYRLSEDTIRVKLRVALSMVNKLTFVTEDKILIGFFLTDFINKLLYIKHCYQSGELDDNEFGRYQIISLPIPKKDVELPF